MYRNALIFLVIALVLVFMLPTPGKKEIPAGAEDVCHGPRLTTVQERNAAMEAGYAIHPIYGCIEQQSFDTMEAQRLASERAQAQRVSAERAQMATAGSGGFAQARHGFRTAIVERDATKLPLPTPPPHLFVRSDYRNPQNTTLTGYMSPDPADGKRHPAIIWLTGGDTNSLDDFWTPGPDSNDQTARAFREAGVIMVFVTLRGGNGHRGQREWFLGEVDDVLAAATQLAQIAYVDPEQIYLGGHSTGGTLALLVAATGRHFKAVFALGPVAGVDSYPREIVPVDFSAYDPMELKLRSPIHWLSDIEQPTYLIEGTSSPSNLADLDTMCKRSRNPAVHCLRVAGADHFSVIRRATKVIAAQIAGSPEALSLDAKEMVP